MSAWDIPLVPSIFWEVIGNYRIPYVYDSYLDSDDNETREYHHHKSTPPIPMVLGRYKTEEEARLACLKFSKHEYVNPDYTAGPQYVQFPYTEVRRQKVQIKMGDLVRL